ncbi:hypothetical protein CAPTEDRAFT_225988 [Capitella teleta]|uniref:Uncharacterized protein n=1 Tax=Capitella teleta TaxID=283909 RepID=R7UDW8_CAPTE|nr:hypothetical protein CAPTEDRAFT_225988 [Capitella teleta]|eukprot:ELU04189.1 hypothetical protein CAPTEDRAFT_225988 [Capitella teleta]
MTSPKEPIVDDAGDSKKMKEEVVEEYDERPCIFRFITAITHTWGILTLCGVWYCAVELLKDRHKYVYTQYYTLAAAIVVTFFEFAWLFNKIKCCGDDGGCCCTIWRIIVWIDNWKKGILYAAIAIPEFLKGSFSMLAVISGILILVLAIFYFLKSFKYSSCVERRRVKKRTVVTEDPEAALLKNASSPAPVNPSDQRWDSIRQSGDYQDPRTASSASTAPQEDLEEDLNPFSKSEDRNPFSESS